MVSRKNYISMAVTMAVMMPACAGATDGLMFSGYSATTLGMAGAGSAGAVDAQTGATNPAGFAFTGNRLDITGALLAVDIDTTIGGTQYGDNPLLPVVLPSFSYQYDDRWSFGLSSYGVGVTVDYGEPIPAVPGVTDASATLLQFVLAPSVAYKLNEDHAVGASLLLAGQYFDMTGLQAFGVADPGYATSYGAGVSVGYMGRLSDTVRVSAAYFSRIEMGQLDGYEGHLASETDLDMPARIVLGVAVDVTSDLTMFLDYNWIDWSSVRPLANPFPGNFVLGSADGPGGGWGSQHVVKIGAEYKLSDQWTIRGGASASNEVWDSKDNALNYYTPATPRYHLAAGATYRSGNNTEWTVAWNRAIAQEQDGEGMSTGTDLKTQIDTFALTFGWTF